MLIFGIDWFLSTSLLVIGFFYLLPKYLVRMLAGELARMKPEKLLSKISDLNPQSSSLSIFWQQTIIDHIDLLLQKKSSFLAGLVPNSLKMDLASQVVDFFAMKIPWLFCENQEERRAWLNVRLGVALRGFLRARKISFVFWALFLGFLSSVTHVLSIILLKSLG